MPHPRLITLLFTAAIATGSSLAVASPSQADNPIVQLQSNASGKCLQPVNRSPNQGAAIVQETCNGSVSQQWTETSGSSSNSLHFVDRSSQLCLDARGGAVNGTPIEQWTCDSISNENWAFAFGNNEYNEELVSRVSGTWNHCASTPGPQNGVAIELYSCDLDPSEFWSLPNARLAGLTRVTGVVATGATRLDR
jgi:hypothetical protein